jgi:hypothetical protein
MVQQFVSDLMLLYLRISLSHRGCYRSFRRENAEKAVDRLAQVITLYQAPNMVHEHMKRVKCFESLSLFGV